MRCSRGCRHKPGLYASILPLAVYALFGSSRTLAVGPVAVVSLMTASRCRAGGGTPARSITPELALLLALLSGIVLTLMGFGALRLGTLANFLSHPVISGFITAISDPDHCREPAQAYSWASARAARILDRAARRPGVKDHRDQHADARHRTVGHRFSLLVAEPAETAAGAAGLGAAIRRCGLQIRSCRGGRRNGVRRLGRRASARMGVAIVGDIPQGLPPLTLPGADAAVWRQLAASAVLISLVGFVESVSVAQTLAAKRRQRILPNQELIGLGAANIAASLTGGYPVSGGFSRSVVNFDAGAQTPAAGAFTAAGILVATLLLTPYLYFLPQATLAATIIVAVLSLVDLGALRRTWDYSRADFAAMAVTIAVTLLFGVETGIVAGVATSIALHLWRTSRPHCAIVGQVPGTEHFRNVQRHEVCTAEEVITIRIDESLYFPNARFLEDRITGLAADCPELKHIILMCPAVNHIDASALESLEAINRHLRDAGVIFHLSEVKGPVLDRLRRSHFLEQLTGQVFLSQFQAIKTLAPRSLR